MSWSKVRKGKKPLMWWYHKLLCEFWYWKKGTGKGYYYHLTKLCDQGFNLYGEKW